MLPTATTRRTTRGRLQVALLRRLRRRQHDRRRRARRRGLLRPPQKEGEQQYNHFFGPDYLTVVWLEQQGYEVTTPPTSRPRLQPSELLNHKVDLVSGHSEYWSYNEFNNFKAAREAGVSIALAQRQHGLLADPLRKQPPHTRLLQDDPGLQRRQPRRYAQRSRPRLARTVNRCRSSRRPRAAIPARLRAIRTRRRAGVSGPTNRRTRCSA